MIQYILSKLFKKARLAAVINSNIDKTAKIESGSHVVGSSFGKYSYCGYDCEILNCEIGNYVSIANNCKMGGQIMLLVGCRQVLFFITAAILFLKSLLNLKDHPAKKL